MSRRVFLVSIVLGLLMTLAGPVSALAPPYEQLPDGDSRPIILATELLDPQPHNALLEADIWIEATDNDGILRYEYRWNRLNPGRVFATSAAEPIISYASVRPKTYARLEVRAVDLNGWRSAWHTAWTGITPSAPMIVLAGDSIASGYTRRWFTGEATCRDAGYSFGATVRDSVAATLPAAWAPDYVNIAFPGAGMSSVIDGGSDSCSNVYPSQIDEIERYTDTTTWNVVVVTAGINSTNWGEVVQELTKDTALSWTKAGDKLACQEAITERWNLSDRRGQITAGASKIVQAIRARANASVYWASYFAIDGTPIVPGWSPIGPECSEEMDSALRELHGAIRAGLDHNVTWVDIEELPIDLQMWAGWPHPNPDGHHTIGLAVAQAITS